MRLSSLTEEAVSAVGGRWTDCRGNDDDFDDSQSDYSRNTSTVSLNSTMHSKERVNERDIKNKRLLQATKLYGKRRPNTMGRNGWVFEYFGICLVTDQSTDTTITAYITDKQVYF